MRISSSAAGSYLKSGVVYFCGHDQLDAAFLRIFTRGTRVFLIVDGK